MKLILKTQAFIVQLVAFVLVGMGVSPLEVRGQEKPPFVALVDMNMMILPGTAAYLSKSIEQASNEGAKIIIVEINTPGGILSTSQEMIQTIFKSPIPVVIYVTPSGSTATSAGVFITLAGHVAAMAPGTSIGAAHPVTGEGKDIEGDMRKKAENMTVAMVKSIAEQRGRNVEWAEKAVKESSSLTEKEASKMGVVDLAADDIDDLLKRIKGKKVKLDSGEIVLEDYSKLPRRFLDMTFKDKVMNVFANPNVAALLWLGATTGLSLELYNPGAILPAVVGLICLILALAVNQVIPVTQGGVLLLILGSILIGLELFIPSGVLAIGGIISLVLGTIYLIDVGQSPDMQVSLHLILPTAIVLGSFLALVARSVVKSYGKQSATGFEGLIGLEGRSLDNFSVKGSVAVNGEIWSALVEEGAIAKNDKVVVVGVGEGLVLKVKRVE